MIKIVLQRRKKSNDAQHEKENFQLWMKKLSKTFPLVFGRKNKYCTKTAYRFNRTS